MFTLIAAGITAAVVAGATAYSEYKASEAASEAKKAAQENAEATRAWAEKLIQDVQEHNKNTSGYGTAQDVENYGNATRNTDYVDMYNKFWDKDGDGKADDPDEFNYNKSIDDFLNPNRDKLIGTVAKNTLSSAFGGGMGRSWDGANQMATAVADKNEQLYANALNEYKGDREFAYKSWSDFLQRKREQYNDLVGATKDNNDALKGLADEYLAEQRDEFSNLVNAQIAAQNMVTGANNTVANTGNYTYDYAKPIVNGVAAFGAVNNNSNGNKY